MSAADSLTPMPKLVRDELDNGDHYEIIDGVRVELPPTSADSQAIASRLVRHLSNRGIAQNLGEAYAEMLFKLPLAKDRNRKPDVAFITYASWPRTKPIPSTNAWDVLPDLCVEVLSPTNTRAEIAEKVTAYLAAGAREAWVVGDDGAPEIHTSAGPVAASTLGFVLPRPPQA